MLQSLYNTEISEARAVGYCRRHHCHLSCTQLRRKECLKKQCTHLQKCEHEFWRQRELTKAKRQQRKIIMKGISSNYGREGV